ncbi:5-(carboxyamino)imidazole ribonucleotide synthase [Halobium salinum]|uniref:N5-carboxyaminoimidazole ribonucleotide synthase n=1 Tax=Halobium salinum TaxID=1364940 RepID=A0ABD5PH32_9EURY|nr:5-(carboxyamino)imidazole ribonucleotide synthase [Halobium salinum]
MTISVPGPTLGVVGGGQLGRMLAEAASPLGVDVVVLDPTPEPPAGRVADAVAGAFDDADAVRSLAERVDALTFEIELADPDLLASVREEYDVPVHPSPEALRTTGDKLLEKQTLDEAGVPVPRYRRVDDADDLREALEAFAPSGGVMLKARTGGYDGRGNVPVEPGDDPEAALADIGNAPAVAEELIDFEREVSVVGVRGENGTRQFPLGENVHEAEILRETVAPARTSDAVAERAHEVAEDVLAVLDGRGVFGIELFECEPQRGSGTSSGRGPRDSDGEILVNEIAPRPHNSGHWTIEGARTSQFEQHVRAVLGWPLGSTALRAPTVSANILGDVEEPTTAELRGVDAALAAENVSLHWYGKREARPLRKMGHITATADADPEDESARDDLLARAREVRDRMTFRTD